MPNHCVLPKWCAPCCIYRTSFTLKSSQSTHSFSSLKPSPSDLIAISLAENYAPLVTMALTLHEISIASFIRNLTTLSAILKKGEHYANENSIPHSKLLEARLIPDMAAFPFQIQRVSDIAKGVAVRVAGVSPVSMPDEETTFDELQARITKTVDLLKAVTKSSIDGKEDDEVTLKTGGGEMKFTGKSYVLVYALPNFYFHVNMAYAILRAQGVPLGKKDYLGDM